MKLFIILKTKMYIKIFKHPLHLIVLLFKFSNRWKKNELTEKETLKNKQ